MAKLRFPQFIAVLLTLAAIAAFFLPYISSTEEYAKYLDQITDITVSETIDMTYGEMKDLSLFEYAKVYLKEFGDETYGIFYAVLTGSVGVFSFFAFLCASKKKPILLFIFSALIGLVSYSINIDFIQRGIMPNSNRVWGISHEILIPIAIALCACAIWMLIAKISIKKYQN